MKPKKEEKGREKSLAERLLLRSLLLSTNGGEHGEIRGVKARNLLHSIASRLSVIHAHAVAEVVGVQHIDDYYALCERGCGSGEGGTAMAQTL
jgi:hypothetical protein